MRGALYKEFWAMRFREMLRLEEEGVSSYEALLEECQSQHKTERTLQAELKNLIADEKKHVRLVRELLEIVARQAD